jgi:hypothetical protein
MGCALGSVPRDSSFSGYQCRDMRQRPCLYIYIIFFFSFLFYSNSSAYSEQSVDAGPVRVLYPRRFFSFSYSSIKKNKKKGASATRRNKSVGKGNNPWALSSFHQRQRLLTILSLTLLTAEQRIPTHLTSIIHLFVR